MAGDATNVRNRNIQGARIYGAVSLPAIPRSLLGGKKCVCKYLEHKRMENNNKRDPLVAPQIGWGEESVGLLLLRASKDDDVVAAVSFTGGCFIWIPERGDKLSWKY